MISRELFPLILISSFIFIQNTQCLDTPAGALISVHFKGEIGFLLDEIPDVALQNAKDYILRRVSLSNWKKRVITQIKMTLAKQTSRSVNGINNNKQLTIPPQEKWNIKFTSAPLMKSIQNHSYISRSYTFYSVLVTRKDSVYQSEPSLVPIGGVYTQTYPLPIDPNDIFQRTGYACMNEAAFSLQTVTSSNGYYFFDSDCDDETYIPIANRTYNSSLKNCHWTSFPNVSCIHELKNKVGFTDTTYFWTRLPWSNDLASKWRYGRLTSDSADLSTVNGTLENTINYQYRYFPNDSCALFEAGVGNNRGCIDKAGWRQLLKFTSTAVNVGKTDFFLGTVTGAEEKAANFFVWSDCHRHYHFQHYGKYMFGSTTGRKVGFCLQTTWRYFNNEWVSLSTPYETCMNQGLSPGWGDDYVQGIDCQWIDVTDLKPKIYELSETFNNDNFMCEGTINTYPNGSKIWIPTDDVNLDNNKTQFKLSCNFTPGYADNNFEYINVNFTGSDKANMVLPCKYGAEITPLKDCEFNLQYDNLVCEPSKAKRVILQKTYLTFQKYLIVRICESSIALGHTTYCEYVDSLANVLYTDDKPLVVNFLCPGKRDAIEVGGRYSIFVSSLIPDQHFISKLKIIA